MLDGEGLPLTLGLPIVVVLLLANGIFVAAEFALVTVRRTRINQLADDGNRAARRVKRALGNLDFYIAAAQLGITMASILLGYVGEPVLAAIIEPPVERVVGSFAPAVSHTLAIAVAFLFVTALHIIIGEFVPKTIALEQPERTALGISLPLGVFVRLFRPVIWLLNAAGFRLLRMLGMDLRPLTDEILTAEDLAHTFESSASAGLISRREMSLTRHLLRLAELECRDLMVPRGQLVGLDVDNSWEDVLSTFARRPFTRYPVYDGSIDDIVGILDAKTLLLAPEEERPEHWRQAVEQPTMLPESVSVEAALALMQQQDCRMVVLVDEYGGTAGIITQFDIVRYLATDLPPEVRRDERFLSPARTVLPVDISGLVPIEEVGEVSGVELPESEASTIGGLVMEVLNRIPETGDAVEIEGLRLTVLEMRGRRVARVRVAREDERAAAGETIVASGAAR